MVLTGMVSDIVKTGHMSVNLNKYPQAFSHLMFISYLFLGIGENIRIQRHRGEQIIDPVHKELTVWRGKKNKSFIMGHLISYQTHIIKSDAAK